MIILKSCNQEFNKPEDFIPHLKRVTTWKRLTPTVVTRLILAAEQDLVFKTLKGKDGFKTWLNKNILGLRRGHFTDDALKDVFGWTDEEILKDAKWKWDIETLEDFAPHLQCVSKNWKKFTPRVSERLQTLLNENIKFSTKYEFYEYLRKQILEMRSGTFQEEHYVDIFGWATEEARQLLSDKGQLFKESTHGGLTPNKAKFWEVYHKCSAAKAKERVSKFQRKLSIRKKKTKINQPTSIDYWLNRGHSQEQAVSQQSLLQKLRRNNCVEYWTSRGYSAEDAKLKISEIQKTRSQLSVNYWLHRGHDVESAQKNSLRAQRQQLPAKFSKVSQRFFIQLVDQLVSLHGFKKEDCLFGENEKCVYLTKRKRVFLDFLHVPSNKIIEFDGIFWHKNPERDKSRDNALEKIGFKTLRVPETYNIHMWNKYISQAIQFLLKGQNELNSVNNVST